MLPTTRLLSTAFVALLLALGAPAVATASDDSSGAKAGWIRAGHLAPGVGKADIEISPYQGGRTRTLDLVTYGSISPYERVPAGLYTVALVPPGGTMAQAMVRQTVRVQAGTASTVFAAGRGSDVTARVVTDDLTAPPSGDARIRLVSAAGDTPKVDATVVGGPDLASNAAFGSVSGYADVPAQTWRVRVSATGAAGTQSLTRDVTVSAGSVYTLLVLDGTHGLKLSPVVDSAGASVMPTGGVDTGGGYLATTAAAAPRAALRTAGAVGTS